MRKDQNTKNAKSLRANQSDAESRLWHQLRNRRLNQAKFRRQHPIGPYIADFCCVEHRLIVELDGGQHASALMYDLQRTALLQSHGFQVLRFWNDDVLLRMDAVLGEILRMLQGPHPNPLPPAGEGTVELASPACARGTFELACPAREQGNFESGVK
jgi:very-short-patch-repair endonuclease